jgi:hypothetical protein
MSETFPNTISNSQIENDYSRIYDHVNFLKNNPKELEKHISGAINALGLEKDAFIESSVITSKIVENIIEEINPNVKLSCLDQKEVRAFRLMISGMNKGRNREFYFTPAEIEARKAEEAAAEQVIFKDRPSLGNTDRGVGEKKLENAAPSVKPYDAGTEGKKKSKWTSGVDEATKKFE